MSSTGLVSLYVAYIFYLHDMKFVDCCSFCEISRCEKEQKIESDSKFVQDFGVPPSHVTLWDQLTNRWPLKIDPDLNRCISLLKVRGYSNQQSLFVSLSGGIFCKGGDVPPWRWVVPPKATPNNSWFLGVMGVVCFFWWNSSSLVVLPCWNLWLYTLGLINGWNLQITRAPIQEHLPGKLGKLLFRISWDISVDRPKVDLKSSSSLDQKVVSWCPFLDEWKISKYNFWPFKKTSPLKNPRQNVCT